MKFKKKNIEQIIICIADMLSNNAELGTDGIAENFTSWLEDGNAFDFMQENEKDFTEQDINECIAIMKRVAPLVDNLTNELYNIFEENEE